MTRNRWFMLIGLVVSGALAWIVVERLDWPVFWAALDRVKVAKLILAVPLLISGVASRGYRWRLIVVGQPGHLADFMRATCLGYLGNTILPLRAGEILRVLAINRLTDIAVARAMAGAVADRVFDAAMLGVMLLIVLAVHGAAVADIDVSSLDIALVAGGFVVVAVVIGRGPGWRRPVRRLANYLPDSLFQKITRYYNDVTVVSKVLREPKKLAVMVALTIVATASDLLLMGLVMAAFDWPMPLMAAVTVVVFLNIGGLLPAAPGYIGVFQIACLFALGFYGIGETEAVAFSVVLQLLVIFLLIVLGVVAMISCGDRLGPWRRSVAQRSKGSAG